MKRKKILIIGAVLLAGIVVTVAIKYYIERRVYLATSCARRRALSQTHYHFSKHGPELTRLHTEMMLLGAYRHSEELLSHPFAPWWPRRTRGSYEQRVPFWERPSRTEQLDRITSGRIEFGERIGVTNRQQEADLFSKYVQLIREANKNLEPISGSQ